MRCFRLTGPGVEGLRQGTAETPTPGPGEILVRMQAASLNYRDLILARLYPEGRDPFVPLSDGAGEIVALGSGATRFAIGDPVVGCFHATWLYGPIPADWETVAMGGGSIRDGGGADGVLTEYKIFREDAVVHAPAGLSAHEAATLPCAAVSAWNGVMNVRAQDTILIQGTGGVSLFALQFAKAAGARVIATSSSDEKIARLRSLGADETINYLSEPDWEQAVRRVTGGRGVDLVVEVGGGGTLAKSLASTVTGGEIALIGVLTQGKIDPYSILHAAVSVRPIIVGSREMFEAMNRRIVQHAIRPIIDRTFPFEEAPAAYRYLEAAGHFGKVVIDIGEQ